MVVGITQAESMSNTVIILTMFYRVEAYENYSENYYSQSDKLANTIEPEIFIRRKFSPISPPGLVGENFVLQIFLSCVNDYIKHMETFTVFAKIA